MNIASFPISILFLILSFANGVVAQTVFSGTVNSLPSSNVNVILEYFKEEGWKHLQSVKCDENGHFQTNLTFNHTGQYRMRLSLDPKKWGDFIINKDHLPADGFQFTIDYSDLKGDPILIDNSKESQAYLELMKGFNLVSIFPDSIDKTSLQVLEKERDFSRMCRKIMVDCAGTYSADVLAPTMSSPESILWKQANVIPDSLVNYRMKHALDAVPFGNMEIIYHVALIRRLNNFYADFDKKNAQEKYIDQLMNKSLINEEMSTFMFRFVLDKMIDYRCESGLSYLITWYAQDCTDNEHMDEQTKNLLTALDKCKPGSVIEFLTLPDLNGKMISSKEVFSKNKITLIMFWKGSCSHCKEFEPLLEEIYKEYHPKGLEVYAIGSDKLKEEWETQALANKSPWPSVFLAFDQRKDFNKRFAVPSTPTLIAVDSHGIILRRLIMRSKLEASLDEMFQELEQKPKK